MLQPPFLDELFASFELDNYTARSLRFTPPDDNAEVIAVAEYLQPNRLIVMIEEAAKQDNVAESVAQRIFGAGTQHFRAG